MKRRRLGLIGLNVVLLGVLAIVTLQPSATAQPPGGAARQRGQYLLLSGRMQGSTTNAIYVLDSANQEMLALRWDRSAQRLDGIGYRNIATDASTAKGR